MLIHYASMPMQYAVILKAVKMTIFSYSIVIFFFLFNTKIVRTR